MNIIALPPEALEQHRSALEQAGVRIVGPDWLAGFLAGLDCRNTDHAAQRPEPEPPAKPKRKPRACDPNPSQRPKVCELCHETKGLHQFQVGHSVCRKCERKGAVVYEPGKKPRALDQEDPMPSLVTYDAARMSLSDG